MRLGIDATNLTRGGGRTHLVEILKCAKPLDYGFREVVVWATHETLNLIDCRDWLVKCSPRAINNGLLQRLLWQQTELAKEVTLKNCDLLFVPGGLSACKFRSYVTMSRNMLPFDLPELWRYGWSFTTIRLLLLRFVQTSCLRQADGIVFLTEYARSSVQQVTGKLPGLVTVIPHGLNSRFMQSPRIQHSMTSFTTDDPLRFLYVSIVDQYKHTWVVVEAIARLRASTGWPLALDLVGPSYPPALSRLNKAIDLWDPDRRWVRYHGSVPYDALHTFYHQADVGIFASSCENMPNILLEMMAAGLPIACSNRGPMPDVLRNAGVFFDPLNPLSIQGALRLLLHSPKMRYNLSRASYQLAQGFSWDLCSASTFKFLSDVCRNVSLKF